MNTFYPIGHLNSACSPFFFLLSVVSHRFFLSCRTLQITLVIAFPKGYVSETSLYPKAEWCGWVQNVDYTAFVRCFLRVWRMVILTIAYLINRTRGVLNGTTPLKVLQPSRYHIFQWKYNFMIGSNQCFTRLLASIILFVKKEKISKLLEYGF